MFSKSRRQYTFSRAVSLEWSKKNRSVKHKSKVVIAAKGEVKRVNS